MKNKISSNFQLDDHSRVKLMTKEEGDYINANFVSVS